MIGPASPVEVCNFSVLADRESNAQSKDWSAQGHPQANWDTSVCTVIGFYFPVWLPLCDGGFDSKEPLHRLLVLWFSSL